MMQHDTAATLADSDMRLIEGWQRGFPLLPRPYAAIGRDLGMTEGEVIDRLHRLRTAGILARVGATVRPNAAGASTLAAISAAPERVEEIAAIVNAEPAVTHNYEREHAFNLWFVVTSADRAGVAATLDRIRGKTRLDVLDLPLLRSYFIDLGFPLRPDDAAPRRIASGAPASAGVSGEDRRLLRAIEDGLPLTSLPYRRVATVLRVGQIAVIRRLARMLESGAINRLGLIVRHRELGFIANAMAVWDIADSEIDAVGERVAAFPSVTLCYRRQRRPPKWPYNLFWMVHGRDRAGTLRRVTEIADGAGIAARPHAILFSTRRFKQRGATLARA
jgi:DNA-binding Lrp family transcriptional regulator